MQFTFLPSRISLKTRKEVELVDAQAKSHAARVVALRKKVNADEETQKRAIEKSRAQPRPNEKVMELETSDIQSSALQAPNPQMLLGQGRIDPFFAACTNNNPSVVMNKALHYAFDALWPKDMAGVSGSVQEKWTVAARTRGVNLPFMFCTQLSCAARLCALLCVERKERKWLLTEERRSRKTAFRLISEAINAQMQDSATIDVLIHAILMLGTTEGTVISPPQQRGFKVRSPMMDAFIYELYGHFAPSNATSAHHKAVISLVEERGGIEALDPTVGMPIQVVDIAVSTWNNTQPYFPLRHATKSLLSQQIPVLDSPAVRFSLTLGTGFTILDSRGVDCALRKTLSKACRLTILVEQYHRGGIGSLTIDELSLAVIAFQHGLCSLLPLSVSMLNVATFDQCLGEAIRIALFIYSTRVFYPPIRPYEVEVRAARELMVCTQYLLAIEASMSVENEKSKYSSVVMWLLVLGAIAAEPGEDCRFYVCELRKRGAGNGPNGKSDFGILVDIMRSLLWWSYIFDAPLREILDQVEDAGQT